MICDGGLTYCVLSWVVGVVIKQKKGGKRKVRKKNKTQTIGGGGDGEMSRHVNSGEIVNISSRINVVESISAAVMQAHLSPFLPLPYTYPHNQPEVLASLSAHPHSVMQDHLSPSAQLPYAYLHHLPALLA